MPTLEHKKRMLKHMQAETRKAGDVFLLWSTEHRAWWGPGVTGHVRDVNKAGCYSHVAALEIALKALPGQWQPGAPPNRKNRLARATLMRRVTVVVDPLSGLNPIFANAEEIRADSAMTTRSAAAISDTLPPATLPETAATTGARIRTIRAIAA
jgi:hypothetical protein